MTDRTAAARSWQQIAAQWIARVPRRDTVAAMSGTIRSRDAGAPRGAVSWAELERQAPGLAEAGRRQLVGDDGVAIGFLATSSVDATPHLSPVCPVFCGDHLYVSAGARTPKARDLSASPTRSGAYVLHAFLGAHDEEFQVAGRAALVDDPAERSAVHEAIPFAAFQRDDPIFRLEIERSLHVYWERVGQPDTRAVRERWFPACGVTGAEPGT